MSNSYRKTPAGGTCVADSEKQDKRLANRRWRRRTRLALRADKELPLQREVSNLWDFAKDGRSWFGPIWPWSFRKDGRGAKIWIGPAWVPQEWGTMHVYWRGPEGFEEFKRFMRK